MIKFQKWELENMLFYKISCFILHTSVVTVHTVLNEKTYHIKETIENEGRFDLNQWKFIFQFEIRDKTFSQDNQIFL